MSFCFLYNVVSENHSVQNSPWGVEGDSQLKVYKGAPVAQWVKHWPTDLAVRVLPPSPSRQNLFNRKRGSFAHNLSLSLAHCPVMTEILLKRT